MPDPADLPLELFDMIMDLSLDFSDPYHISKLSQLNSRWYSRLLESVYRNWVYNGAKQPFKTLFCFVRTIRCEPRFARMVRKLNVGNWGYFPWAVVNGPPDLVPIEEKDKEWIRAAIQDTELGDEEAILTRLSRRDRRPLMAMLLASVPNISSLWAHVPLEDPFLALLMQRTLIQPALLGELRELHLFPEVPVLDEYNTGWNDEPPRDTELDQYLDEQTISLNIEHLWPGFYLPKLQTLSLHDLQPITATESLVRRMPTGGSCIENLCVTFSEEENFATMTDVFTLARMSARLKSLSLFIPGISGAPEFEMHEFLRCLNVDTLEYLDLHLDPENVFDAGRGQSLRGFHVLKDIRIHNTHLTGPFGDSHLKDILPPSLESLSLYTDLTALDPDVKGLLNSNFTSLGSITLEEIEDNIDDPDYPDYNDMKEYCIARGVTLSLKRLRDLSMGGQNSERWLESLYMATDGHDRRATASKYPRTLCNMTELLIYPEDQYEGLPNTEHQYGPYRSRKLKDYIVPFTDHQGSSAYMLFTNQEHSPLPPLYSFAIYFTHPRATYENADLMGLYKKLKEEDKGDFDVRFDMYILPSASYEGCVRHYCGEKRKRRVFTAQVRMLDSCRLDEPRPVAGTQGQLPGLVPQYYSDYSDPGQHIFISENESWKDGEGLVNIWFPRLPAPGTLPEFETTPAPLLDITPEFPAQSISERLFQMVYVCRDRWFGAWQTATSWGWKTW